VTGFLFYTKKMEEGISAQAEADGFEWNNFFRGNISQVDVGTQQLDEPDLLGLLRRLPDNFLERNFGEYFLHKSGAHFA
jgi:hypothetical protein